MTEETQQPDTPTQSDCHTSNADSNRAARDNKKEKCRSMTKVVIRRLPPTMTQEQFVEQVSPLSEHDYLYFVKADVSMGQYAFSRAYINFIDQRDIFIFREKFDNYVFIDGKGNEYPAVVEFAPFQRLPKKRNGKKKDPKCSTIDADPHYISFIESLKSQEADAGTGLPKTEYSYQPCDNTTKKVTSTPLLEYLKQRKQEKQRLRDEKREERRRRDLERRRAKDEPVISKVLKNPDMDKERVDRDNKENKEEKEKGNSPKDGKNRNKREERLREKIARDAKTAKNYRDREDRNKERDNKHQRRHDDKKSYGRREDRENVKDDVKRNEAKVCNDGRHDWKEDFKERKMEEKRGKSYEKMRQEKKKREETRRQSIDGGNVGENNNGSNNNKSKTEEKNEECATAAAVAVAADDDDNNNNNNNNDDDDDRHGDGGDDVDDDDVEDDDDDGGGGGGVGGDDDDDEDDGDDDDNDKKLHSKESGRRIKSIERHETRKIREKGENRSEAKEGSPNVEEKLPENETTVTAIEERIPVPEEKSHESKSKSNEHIDKGREYENSDARKDSKTVKRRSSLESGGEGGAGDGGYLRRHKSLDGADQSNLQKGENEEKDKDKKDPRLERRIRNKDRPAMEIYRPGMGKFSKQRLEREKSNNDDNRASLSQSPTPNSGVNASAKIGKPGTTEVRSMTFKRSVSRDAA